ncbi:MAG: CDP-glycerol glycerophosphotransferase family protein [Eubacterium sp.]|nr:CDP-glycerol glycerophosphotransferase family protein [Eubacterium sp.]MCH4046978.1 CDP-glycerol glycerophosphotransferase family protein [Eubacterium sp.]MCH4080075.1 CDP-glycerol glycerophosphotransferase family protein [Eubacterium sp.]MCH4109883.1 CDP-glycerol glycerophosphotransferase family protein [Eubacterium sp.]MCI1308073.1 CDP-glycerol glycerophosphotransferase family protein [Eubacterium sp.]
MNTQEHKLVRPDIKMNNRVDEHLIRVTIQDIRWERIIMHFTCHVEGLENLDPSKHLRFYAITSFYMANAKYKAKKIDDNTYDFSLNVTNPGYCRCLPIETYHFAVCVEDDILAIPEISEDLAPKLADKSREFLYSGKNRAYVVDFSIAEDDTALFPEMRVLNTKKAGIADYNVPDEEETPNAVPEKKKHMFLKKGQIRNMIKKYYAFESNKFDKSFDGTIRTVMFMSEQSEKLGSNLTSVYQRMQERGLDKNYEILFSARSAVEKRYSEKSWYELIKKVARADMIFVDDHCPFLDWLTLSPRTKLIQLWHAGAGFKSSGYSRWGHTGCPAPVSCHRQYDYGISSSDRIAHFHSEVFGINPEQLLPTGMPRMDEFLDPEYRKKTEKKLYKKFPQIEGKKVILFAPTYRGKNRSDANYPYEMIDFDRLYKFCADEYVVLFKMHPWVSQAVPIPEAYKDKMIDVNKYPNINDLFYVTDLMITDYSSGIFEYSLMRKPMLFFAFDEIQYSYSRGFHRPYEESAPGKVCHTFDELMTAMENKDYDYEKVEEYVKLHFDNIDSKASDRVIDWILLGNIPEKNQKRINAIKHSNYMLRRRDFSSLEEADSAEK